jgi:hypothetical protein
MSPEPRWRNSALAALFPVPRVGRPRKADPERVRHLYQSGYSTFKTIKKYLRAKATRPPSKAFSGETAARAYLRQMARDLHMEGFTYVFDVRMADGKLQLVNAVGPDPVVMMSWEEFVGQEGLPEGGRGLSASATLEAILAATYRISRRRAHALTGKLSSRTRKANLDTEK